MVIAADASGWVRGCGARCATNCSTSVTGLLFPGVQNPSWPGSGQSAVLHCCARASPRAACPVDATPRAVRAHLLGLPHVDDGHAGHDRVGVLQRGRVHGVVRADDQRHVSVSDLRQQTTPTSVPVPVPLPRAHTHTHAPPRCQRQRHCARHCPQLPCPALCCPALPFPSPAGRTSSLISSISNTMSYGCTQAHARGGCGVEGGGEVGYSSSAPSATTRRS